MSVKILHVVVVAALPVPEVTAATNALACQP